MRIKEIMYGIALGLLTAAMVSMCNIDADIPPEKPKATIYV